MTVIAIIRDSYSHNDSDRETVHDGDNVNVNININDNDNDNNDNDNDNNNDNGNRLTSTNVSYFEGKRVTCIFSLQAQKEPTFNHFCMYFGQGHLFTSVIAGILGQLIFRTGSGPSSSNAIFGLQINQNTFQSNKKVLVIIIFIALIIVIVIVIVLVLVIVIVIVMVLVIVIVIVIVM